MLTISEAASAVKRKTHVRIALLADGSTENIVTPLRRAGYEIDIHLPLTPSTLALRALAEDRDIILIDISIQPRNVLETLKTLNNTAGIDGIRPRTLCFSTVHRNPNFVADIQRCGVRHVRISDAAMLLEAIALMLWEMNELERHGPEFRITHRYSQGLCAPGEVIEAVEILGSEGSYHHLPLALTERLIFEVLARHQRIASDSLQIVTSIRGEWFFRDYGVNAGSRQTIKVRRPTVKVSIERIRKALAIVFEKTNISLDPYDVLRSCLAVGTNRVLYKLHGRVEWSHPRMKR